MTDTSRYVTWIVTLEHADAEETRLLVSARTRREALLSAVEESPSIDVRNAGCERCNCSAVALLPKEEK